MKSTWIPAKKHKRLVTSRNSCLAQNMFFLKNFFKAPTICFNSTWILQCERPDFPFVHVKAEVLDTEVPLDCCSPARTADFSLLFLMYLWKQEMLLLKGAVLLEFGWLLLRWKSGGGE